MSPFKMAAVLAAPLTLTLACAAQAGGYTPPVVAAPVVAPSAAPVADWAGAYVGADLGYAFGGDDRIRVRRADGLNSRELGKYELAGANLGLRAGYRWQRDRWVFGPEIGLAGGEIKDDFTSGGYSGKTKLKSAAALRFKTGYLVNDVTLLYGIAGVSRAKFDYSVTGTEPFAAVGIDDDFSATGYVLGFGAERRLTERLSLTGEYEYADYGKTHLRDANSNVTPATPKFHNVRIGLNYRF